MSREILEAMSALAREKGIAPEKLHDALEDALQSAYKKQPGAAKYARVELDDDTGDFRVYRADRPRRARGRICSSSRAKRRARSTPRRGR